MIAMANRIVLNEISYHGAGAIREIPAEVKVRGFGKAFVCSDPDLVKFGVTKKVLDVLEGEGMAYELYSEIKPNPTVENVQTGVAAFKKSGADYLIAIGGGSSMDTAKAIGIIINNPEFEDVVSLEGVAPTKNKSVPIFAVPTTAGTAAEAAAVKEQQHKQQLYFQQFHERYIHHLKRCGTVHGIRGRRKRIRQLCARYGGYYLLLYACGRYAV